MSGTPIATRTLLASAYASRGLATLAADTPDEHVAHPQGGSRARFGPRRSETMPAGVARLLAHFETHRRPVHYRMAAYVMGDGRGERLSMLVTATHWLPDLSEDDDGMLHLARVTDDAAVAS